MSADEEFDHLLHYPTINEAKVWPLEAIHAE